MDRFNIICTTAFGLEAMLGRELDSLFPGTEHKAENGRIYFEGGFEEVAKANMYLRCADRVLIAVGKFPAKTFEELFQGVKAIPWEEIMPKNAQFIVNGRSQKSQLFSIRDCQAITKKSIAERLKAAYGLEWIEETGPLYQTEVVMQDDIATITIDTSGHGLHKRGYRAEVGGAPIKETLAAAMIALSYWKPGRILLDPFCGTGTIAIEAAMMEKNIAPGLNSEFDFEHWTCVPEGLSERIREEAKGKIVKNPRPRIFASDIDGKQLELAKKHAELAGVSDCIVFKKCDFSDAFPPVDYGILICNPPYGERLMEQSEIEELYKRFGKVSQKHRTWTYYVITSCETFEKLFGRRSDKRRKLYNGALKCDYYQYFGPKPPEGAVDIAEKNADKFIQAAKEQNAAEAKEAKETKIAEEQKKASSAQKQKAVIKTARGGTALSGKTKIRRIYKKSGDKT